MDQLLDRFLDRIALAHFVEIAQAVAIVHRGHLVLVVNAFLPDAQDRVIDVAGGNLNCPRRRYERLRPRRRISVWHPQLVIRQCIGDQHRDGVRFLSG